MVAVPVNPKVLIWARDERGLSLADASVRLKFTESELLALEQGTREPTLGDLERLSSQYKIPLASLLMPAPLPSSTRPKMKDFRAFDGMRLTDLSPETILAIEEAHDLVEGLADLKALDPLYIGGLALPVYSLADDPERVAERERARIGLEMQQQFSWTADREAFLRWRGIVEDQIIFAYQLKLGEDGTRGFSICDDREIPVIVIDASEESYKAKVFTIWHEYAHVLLRTGGISDQNRTNAVERFCNAFAAFFLMPRTVFLREAAIMNSATVGWKDSHVTRLANRFRVSKSSIAIHLEELDLAQPGFYREMKELWRVRRPRPTGGRATPAQKHANRLGNRYVEVVFDAVDRGIISALDAYEFIRVKPKYFPELRKEVEERRSAYGRVG